MPRVWPALLAIACALPFLQVQACGDTSDTLVLGAATSLQDSGLLDEVVKAFEARTGYEVTPVVAGSGQALALARRGEVDATITHSPADEEQLVAEGQGIDRRPVMENYFLLAGPPHDPARAAGASTLAEAFGAIAGGGQTFMSRGDNSGTHRMELAVWQELGIEPQGQPWYQESAVGQGQNLLVASDKGAYTLVDTATFIVFRERLELEDFLTDRDRPNRYSLIRVNPQKHPGVNARAAEAFADFVTSAQARQLIEDFGRDRYGESLFRPVSGR